MIEVGNIVTLEDNLEYLLLEDVTKNGAKYLYAVRVLIDESPTDEYLVFEAITDQDGEYLKVVEDKKLYDELIEDFKEKVSNKILGLDENEGSNL